VIEIYGDLLFIENLFMNYMVLLLTTKVCSIVKRSKRIFLGAVVGALYSFVFLIPSISFLGSTAAKLGMSVFIVFLAFYPVKKKTFIKLFISFYIINFAFGGLILGTIYFTRFSGFIKNNIFYINNISYFEVITIGLCGYLLINNGADVFKNKIIKKDLEMKVVLEIENQRLELKGIVDTGNFLKDPISKSPVIVAEYDKIVGILPEEIKTMVESEDLDLTDSLYKIGWWNRIHIIPYSSIGKDRGTLLAIRPDKLQIEKDGLLQTVENALIGLHKGSLREDEEYSILLHPEIIKGDI
jgi:stage II sporulation protein GA (sporulation sigma-E factor processing peptidase)